MTAPLHAPELDSLPAPSVDGTAAMEFVHRPSGLFEHLDWRSSLLSLLTHLLFVALVFALAYWMGKPPPPELPAIEVSLAQDPEPPPPPPASPPHQQSRPQPPPPPPPLPRASQDSSLGAGAPQATKRNDAPTARPAEQAQAPREDKPAPEAKPADKPEEPAASPEPPQPQAEPVPPAPATESAPVPQAAPPVLATEQAPKEARPVAPTRAAPPPAVALRSAPRPAPPPAAELRPQRRSSESTAPPPSPQAGTEKPDGPIAAIYDAWLASVNSKVMEHRSLLRAYFGSSQRQEVRIELTIDRAGRLRDHRMSVSSLYPNLDYTLNRMVAQAAPFPPPPSDIPGDPVTVTIVIRFPSTMDEWRQAFP